MYPYQDALDRSDIVLDNLDDILNRSLLIGNGDISALVYQQKGRFVLNLTKNDVWDARLDTSNAPPLMPTRELKEKVKTLGLEVEGDLSRMLESGEGKDSYHVHSYPCPRLCGRLYLDFGVDSSFKSKYHRLSLREGMIKSFLKKEPATIFACAESNIFVMNQSDFAIGVSLEPVDDEEMPPSKSGEDDEFIWLWREIPGDLDIKPLSFAVAAYVAESKSGLVTVAIVTSNESENPLERAKNLAKDTAKKGFETLQEEQRRWWGSFWSKSGVRLGDKELERMWYRNLYFLACVSRPGKMVTGLFASLTTNHPAWHGDYHTNYNIQQTFWGHTHQTIRNWLSLTMPSCPITSLEPSGWPKGYLTSKEHIIPMFFTPMSRTIPMCAKARMDDSISISPGDGL
jgi:hypothetical protein